MGLALAVTGYTTAEVSAFDSAQPGQFYIVTGNSTYGDRSYRTYIYKPSSTDNPDGDLVLSATGMDNVGRYVRIKMEPIDKKTRYQGTTNSSGTYSVTYPTAFVNAPFVSVEILGSDPKVSYKITNSTNTGFIITTYTINNVLGLLPSYPTVAGISLDIKVEDI